MTPSSPRSGAFDVLCALPSLANAGCGVSPWLVLAPEEVTIVMPLLAPRPALMMVGIVMIEGVRDIDWTDYFQALASPLLIQLPLAPRVCSPIP